MRLFSNRSQRTSKCGKNISDTLGCASCATFFLFLPHFDVYLLNSGHFHYFTGPKSYLNLLFCPGETFDKFVSNRLYLCPIEFELPLIWFRFHFEEDGVLCVLGSGSSLSLPNLKSVQMHLNTVTYFAKMKTRPKTKCETEQKTQTASNNKHEIVFGNNADRKKSPKPKRRKPQLAPATHGR